MQLLLTPTDAYAQVISIPTHLHTNTYINIRYVMYSRRHHNRSTYAYYHIFKIKREIVRYRDVEVVEYEVCSFGLFFQQKDTRVRSTQRCSEITGLLKH